MSARLLLLRHGETTWNIERRWQGWADAPLSELGQRQARDAAMHLGELGIVFSGVVTSDLGRAHQTADILAACLGIDVVAVESGLRERNVGAWTGLTSLEIEARWPAQLAAHRAGELTCQPDGEQTEEMLGRAQTVLAKVAQTRPSPLLVVTHAGVIRALERHSGLTPPAATPNLSGRWFVWRPGELEPGDEVVPVDPALKTAPPSR